jgi:hypothetical protein
VRVTFRLGPPLLLISHLSNHSFCQVIPLWSQTLEVLIADGAGFNFLAASSTEKMILAAGESHNFLAVLFKSEFRNALEVYLYIMVLA